MAALPSPTQVAGNHSAIYEAYYNQVDPNGSGVIQALDAARFLKKSKLSDVILSKVWDLSDPSGRGYLDKGGLFVALKLVALAQAGKEIAMSNINSETPPPKLGELPKVPPMVPPPPASDWSVKPAERDKYNQLFESLQPSNGLIPGNKVKGVLMESKLPLPTLGRIWDLADQDKDGMLDRHEFIVAMHLVYKALEKHTIPAVLPPELRPGAFSERGNAPPLRPPSRPSSPSPSHPHPARPPPPSSGSLVSLAGPPPPLKPAMPPAMSNGPPLIPGLSGPISNSALLADFDMQPSNVTPWVVTPAEKQQYDTLFIKADVDMDGFVSGMEIKDTFLKSGLPQPCLAHIWGLCDWDSSGKLSSEQFALAMWMVQRKLRGIEPPAALAPHMIPPSARGSPLANTNSNPVAAPQSVHQPPREAEISLGPQATPEMEALARDMEQLTRERLSLEAEVSAKEQSIRVKNSEANSLQSELDTLAATLKQLENQRGEAQKRLNDLQAQVEKLRVQASSQESLVKGAEAEAASRREAAQGLRKQEQQLADQLKDQNNTVERLNEQLQRSVLAISQANVKLTHLEEQEQQAMAAEEAIRKALDGGPVPSHHYLSLEPPLSPAGLARLVQGTTPNNLDNKSPMGGDAFGSMNGPAATKDGFASDPFKDDPFASKTGSDDPFAAAFPANNKSDGFAADPFASNSFRGGATPDPFGGSSFEGSQDNKTKTEESKDKDPFGCDPFAILHAPTRDGSSPTPSLPPKKHKQPPPRPAPPRPHQPQPQTAAHAFPTDFSSFNNNNKPSVKVAGSRKPGVDDFTEDPFRDYRYEDPFNLEDPFADAADGPRAEPKVNRDNKGNNNTFSAFETDDFFSTSSGMRAFEKNNNVAAGRQSAPLPTADPFGGGRTSAPTVTNHQAFAAWGSAENATGWGDGSDDWATGNDGGWSNPTPPQNNNTVVATDRFTTNTWSVGKSKNSKKEKPAKEKSPKPPGSKYSLGQAVSWGSLGRHKNKSSESTAPAVSSGLPSEERQLAWAAAEGKRLEEERRERREREDRELQIAMALSIGNQ